MEEIYERAGREVGYWAHRFLQMLRRRRGLETARYLLNAPVTSDGYARLRDAGRLDLTVEALVQKPEWAPLFTVEELARARERYAAFQAMPTAADAAVPGELVALFEEANAAPPPERIQYRERIAAHGAAAIVAARRSVENDGAVGLAVAVIERVAGSHPDRAVAALWAIRERRPGWHEVIDATITRIRAGKVP